MNKAVGGAGNFTGAASIPYVYTAGNLMNGLPNVHFFGGILNNAAVTGNNVTVMYVGRMDGGANDRLVGALGNNWLLGFHLGAKDRAYYGSAFVPGSSAIDYLNQQYTGTIDGTGNGILYGNGTLLGTVTPAAGPNNLALGGGNGANAEHSYGAIGEVLVFNTVLTAAQRVQMEQYLQAKWFGILPSKTAVTVSAGATFDLNGVNQTVGSITGPVGSQITLGSGTLTTGSDNTNTTYSGTIGGTGGLAKVGTGILTLSGTAANTYSGPTLVRQGSLALSKSANTTAIPGDLNIYNSLAASVWMTADNQFGGTNTTVQFLNEVNSAQGNGWFLLNGTTQTIAGISETDNFRQGVVENSQVGAPNAPTTTVAGTLNLAGTGNYSFNGFVRDIDPAGTKLNIRKTGSGTQTFSGDRISYTGTTTIDVGQFILFSTPNFNSATTVNSGAKLSWSGNADLQNNNVAPITLNDGATMENLNPANYTVINAPVTVTAGANVTLIQNTPATTTIGKGFFIDGGLKGSGIVTINSINAGTSVHFRNNNSTFSGKIIVNGIANGTLFAGSGISVGGATTGLQNADIELNGTMELLSQGIGWANGASGAFRMGALTGSGVMIGNFTGGGGTTVTLGNTNTSGTFSGVIANGAGNIVNVVKIGTGTQTLTGVNTYTGGTTVTGGGTLNIGGGGTTGSIVTAPLTVALGSTLAFDFSSAFTAIPLSVAGNLVYTSAAQLGLAGTYGGNQITANGVNVSVNGALIINAGAGGATITGTSTTAAGITSSTSRNITTTGNVSFFGTSTAGSFIDGISLAGVYTATAGTLTFDGTAGPGGAYGFETGVSGAWAGSISTFGNVIFRGTGGTTRNSDLNLGSITGNGTVTMIGRSKGLNTIGTFTSSGGLPYNVNLQTTAGGINGLLAAGTDTTGNGNYTVSSAAGIAISGRTINAGTGNISITAATQLSLAGTLTGNQITASGNNVLVAGAVAINAGAGGATITGTSATAAGISSNTSQNITTTGNVTFIGTSTATGQFIDGISLAGVYTATTGTLTFDGTAAPGGAYGFETGVSGAWAGSISTFGNVVFRGTGGTTRNSDLNLGSLTGNGTVTMIGRSKGLNTIGTFTSSGGLPYNVILQTTAGGINGLLGAGTDTTGNGNYTVNSAAGVTLSGRTNNAGSGNISITATTQLSLAGTLTGNLITATGNNVLVAGAIAINAGAGGATITGNSSTAAGITSNTSQNITTNGNVTFIGTSTSTGQFIDGISLAGVYTATTGTLTFDGTAAPGGAFGFEPGVSGAWGGSVSTFGNVVFRGTGGTTRNSDLALNNLTGNGTVTMIGRSKGLNYNSTFTASGGLPYNVSIQTTNGAGISGLLGAGTDNTGNGSYTVNSSGGVVFNGRTINAGTGTISLTSGTGYSVTGNTTLQAATLTMGDTNNIAITSGMALTLNATGTIPNVISGAGNVVIAGGTITLTAANTYLGTTTINGGKLLVNGSVVDGSAVFDVIVNPTGTLGGSGTIFGTVQVNGGKLAPGASPSILNVGSTALISGSTFEVEIDGLTVGTQYDQLNVTGTVDLGGATLVVDASITPDPGALQTFVVINNDLAEAVTGTFAGLPEGSAISVNGGLGTVFISYRGGSGNDVILSSQPIAFGTPGADTVVLTPTATGYNYSVNGGPDVSIPGTIPFTFNGFAGDDYLVVNVTSFPLPTITYDGGAQDLTSRPPNILGDILRVVGTGGETATYTPSATTTGAGTVVVSGSGGGTINFTGLEPVDITGFATAILSLPSANDVVTLTNGFDSAFGTTPAIVATGTSGGVTIESAHFFGNTTVVIDTTVVAGVDTIMLASASNGHGNTNLAITTGTGADVVNVTGSATFTGGVVITSGAVNFNAGTLSLGGDLGIASSSVQVSAGATISANDIELDVANNVTIAGTVTSGLELTINVDATDLTDVGTGSTIDLTGSVLTTLFGTYLNGGTDADTFILAPQTTTDFYVAGDAPTNSPGDKLTMNVTGLGAALSSPGSIFTGAGSGDWVFTGMAAPQPVYFGSIENLDITGSYGLAYNNDVTKAANLILMRDVGGTSFEMRDGSTVGTLLLSGSLATVLSLTVNGNTVDTAEQLTIDDVNGLPSFSSTPVGTPSVVFNGAAGTNTLSYNLISAGTSQIVTLGDGMTGADSSANIATTNSVPQSLDVSGTSLAAITRTGTGTTPGALQIIAEAGDDDIDVTGSGLVTSIATAGYASVSFDVITSYDSVSILGGDGLDNLQLTSLGGGATNLIPFTLDGGNGADVFGIGSSLAVIGAQVTIIGGAGVDVLNVDNSGSATANTNVVVRESSIDSISARNGTGDILYGTVETLNVTTSTGNDTIRANFGAGASALITANLNGGAGNDQFFLDAATTPSLDFLNLQGGLGSDIFGTAPSGGTGTAVAGGEIIPVTGVQIVIGGESSLSTTGPNPTTPATADNDQLNLNISQFATAEVIDTVTGQVISIGAMPAHSPLYFNGIEDLNLFDGGVLTNTIIGDLYLRSTNDGTADNILFYRGYTSDQDVLIRMNNRMVSNTPFRPTTRIVAYGRGGADSMQLNYTAGTVAAEFHGEEGQDDLLGSFQNDLLVGGGGNDQLMGMDGSDILWGDQQALVWADRSGNNAPGSTDGNDILEGRDGDDSLFGGGGHDKLMGMSGNDYLHGGFGNDNLIGADGNDFLRAGDGNDELVGDNGNDIALAGAGDDLVYGSAGLDFHLAGDGSDRIYDLNDNAEDISVTELLLTLDLDTANPSYNPSNPSTFYGPNDMALLALMTTWSGAGSFATRVTAARSLLLPPEAVNDGDIDYMYGNLLAQDYTIAVTGAVYTSSTGDEMDLL